MVLTVLSCLIIFIVFLISWTYVANLEDYEIKDSKQWIDQLPTLVSTLGVLGTFIGVTVGLTKFNPADVDSSIPSMIEGLETAFYTSICGMVGSLILSRVINHKEDKAKKHYPDLIKLCNATNEKMDTLLEYIRQLSLINSSLQNIVTKISENNESASIDQIKDDIEEMKGQMADFMESFAKNSEHVGNIKDLAMQQGMMDLTTAEHAAAIDNNLNDLLIAVANMQKRLEEMEGQMGIKSELINGKD